jgi:very-short-patch-repair endonuclease
MPLTNKGVQTVDELKIKLQKSINAFGKKAFFEKNLDNEEKEIINAFPGGGLGEKIYNFINGKTELPTCLVCGKGVRFISFSRGYRDYCSIGCKAKNAPPRSKEAITKMQASLKRTMLKKYGVENPFQLTRVRESIKARSDDFYRARKEKTIKANLERYGHEWANQSKEVLEKRAETNKTKYGSACTLQHLSQESTLEQQAGNRTRNKLYISRIVAYCEANSLEIAEQEFRKGDLIRISCSKCKSDFSWRLDREPICRTCNPTYAHKSLVQERIFEEVKRITGASGIMNSRSIIPPKELDIFFPDKKVAIEYNGDYWHAVNNSNHIEKIQLCADKGIKLIQVFEHEFTKNPTQILSNICSFILSGTYSNFESMLTTTDNYIFKLSRAWPIPRNLARAYEMLGVSAPITKALNDITKYKYPYQNGLALSDAGYWILRKKPIT